MKVQRKIFQNPKFNNATATVVRLLTGRRWLYMTANQVAYWQLQEAKRHNVVSERQGQQDVDTRKRTGEAQVGRYANQNEVDLRKIATTEKLNESQIGLNKAKTTEANVHAGQMIADTTLKGVSTVLPW